MAENVQPLRPLSLSWSAIAMGCLICLVIQIALIVLGAAIALATLNVEKGTLPGVGFLIGGGLYLIAVVFVSFFMGGHISVRLAKQAFRSASPFHGLAVWSIVEIVVTAFIASYGFSIGESVTSKIGLGAGSAAGVNAMVVATAKELIRLQPRIVSDIKLKDGLVVSRLETGVPKTGELAARVGKETEKAAKSLVEKSQVKQKVEKTGGTVRRTAAWALFAAFAGYLLSLFSALLGSVIARSSTSARAIPSRP